jgi:hypothetical protein
LLLHRHRDKRKVDSKGERAFGEQEQKREEQSFSMENKKDELTAELDRLGVKYDPKDNKEKLLELIEGAAE